MRVGFLTYGLDREPTGIGRYALELLHALAALPQAPEIVLFTTEREDRHGLWDQFEHYTLPGCYLLPALMTAGNWLLSLATRRYRLDLLHDPNGIAPFLGPRDGARRIVTIHDAFPYVHPKTHNRLDKWRYVWMLPQAARRADTIITVSECSRRDLIHHLHLKTNQVLITPEGVNPRFHPETDPGVREAVLQRYGIHSDYIFYLGGINGRKNISRLLEAYARVQARYPEIRLVVGGKRQWQTGEIDATLKRLDLKEQVHFTGYIAEADLPALYSAAELFVFPSLYEGFGLPPLEAMACGTPVVTSNTTSLVEIAGEAALTIDPYDLDGLAMAIERILSDAVLRDSLRVRGLQQAARFTWERTARETFAIYQQVLERTEAQQYPLTQQAKPEHEQ